MSNHSWNLLRQKVFGQKEYFPLELEEIGKKISRNCKGLPLALVLIGGILFRVPETIYEWKKIANVVKTGDHATLLSKILSLSYDHLPHHLRSCFLYIGGFPEDSEIRTSYLIKLWVAEGFLKQSRFKSLEEVAEDNLEDLVKRNLIFFVRRNSTGKIKSVKIHDLLRDLSLTKAREENLLHPYRYQQGIKNLACSQRISLDPFCVFDTIIGSYAYLRSSSGENTVPLPNLRDFKLLRILDVLKFNFEKFPVEVVELFHLRYLALSFDNSFSFLISTVEFKLPSSIIKLQNLQTLIIRERFRSRATSYLYLPSEVWRMPKLRHIIVFNTFLQHRDDDVFTLTNLQTFSSLMNVIFTERVVKCLSNVKKLGLVYNFGWLFMSLCQLDNLVHLHQLETLNMKGIVSLGSVSRIAASFPPSLKKLSLENFDLPWSDMTILGSLPNLEILKLRKNESYEKEWKTNEGEFPKLKMLLLDEPRFYRWIVESSHLPKLEHLVIDRGINLWEIPSEIGKIPTMKLIELGRGNMILWISALKIQRSLVNDVLQVRKYMHSSSSWQ